MYIIPRLYETTEEANMARLNAYIDRDARLENLLCTPYKDLPEKYKHLMPDESKNQDKTLYEVIDDCIKKAVASRGQAYFIMLGKTPMGFIGYETMVDATRRFTGNRGRFVKNMVLFTFMQGGNESVIAHDALKILLSLRATHTFIHWAAIEGNPAMRAYSKLVRRYGGNRRQSIHDPRMFYYELSGTGNIPDESLLTSLCGIDKGK